jgi:hypothetical protein
MFRSFANISGLINPLTRVVMENVSERRPSGVATASCV